MKIGFSRWNREVAYAEKCRLADVERKNAEIKSGKAYEDAMRRIAELPEDGSKTASVSIADELLVHLAAIQMERDAALAMIEEEWAALELRMEASCSARKACSRIWSRLLSFLHWR